MQRNGKKLLWNLCGGKCNVEMCGGGKAVLMLCWKLRGGNFCGGNCEVQEVRWKWCGRVGALESWL